MTITGMSPYRGGNVLIVPAVMTQTVGAGTWVSDVSDVYRTRLYNSSGSDSDEITVSFWCPGGTYTLSIIGAKASSYGILDIYIDNTEVASFDRYNSTTLYGQGTADSQASISITPGLHTMKFKADGKNAGSSSYVVSVNAIILACTSFSFNPGTVIGNFDGAFPLILPAQTLLYHAIPIQGTVAVVGQTPAFFNSAFYIGSDAVNDQADFYFSLPRGNYTIDAFFPKYSSTGIFDVLIDDVVVLNDIDMYNASTTWHNNATDTFTINTTGQHKFTLKCVGKNASSSHYFMQIETFVIERTS